MNGSLLVAVTRWSRHVPAGVLRALFDVVAVGAWVGRAGGVRQLEVNLARVRPAASRGSVRRLALRGMRSYMRYYAETLELSRLSPEQVRARGRLVNAEHLEPAISEGRAVVLGLGHQANWDLAGAWVTLFLGPVTTVAEKLEPPELFESFMSFREGLGMTVIPLEGRDVFRDLVRVARTGTGIIPLLADRDLTHSGVEVDLVGSRARVAAGPAALALATGAPLVPTTLHYERLRGERRRRARAGWGVVMTFHPPVALEPAAADAPRREQVAALSQRWVDALSASIRAHPEDWHMLQKVFIDDLDPARYARTRAEAGEEGPA